VSDTTPLFLTIERRLDAIPEPDRHDYVPAIRAMQDVLSPEVVSALLNVADAAKVIYDINAVEEPMKIAEAKLLLQAPFRKLGYIE
jgi:hypothetical protein